MAARVMVTGGCGFIGSAVVEHLQHIGVQTFVLDKDLYQRERFQRLTDERWRRIDILDLAGVNKVFEAVRPDAVVHLAAIHFIPHCNAHPFESAHINLTGTANVLDAAKAVGTVSRVLFASTAAVYPILDGPIPESQPVGPLDIYGLSKSIGERLCREFHLDTGIPTVVCRFFNAFGPNETNPHLIPTIHDQINAGSRVLRLGNLEPKRDFIHTSDLAKAIRALLELDEAGLQTYNIGSGVEYSVRDIVRAFENHLGEHLTIETDESRVRAVDRMHLLADISRLTSRTAWRPTISLDEGIRMLLETTPR